MKPALVLIGPGRVGCALAHLLYRAGYPLAAVIGRDQEEVEEAVRFIGCDTQLATTDLQAAAKGTILLLTLPDDQLAEFSAHLSDEVELYAGTTLVHCSGLHPATILFRQRDGIGLLSIHPLLPFADREMAVANLKDCPCALEGDQDRQALGLELITAFGGQAFLVPTEAKALYHAAASIASNFMVGLTACARDLLISCGLDSQQALQLITPLHRATSSNILALGPEKALTGPIVRGDVSTVESHLEALRNDFPETAELYRCLARTTLQLAQNSGRLPAARAAEMTRMLKP
ncbi:Rossmann-like and DUF2520 domain-containing protein [Geopsychrobacter electrodiphilus]|uniref:Rossmann-like and DUF2520 domain-containing protein n=1 Tax=Geopsychrobacter electrodiphilus TaxID=225196 RepID=UPI00037CD771|nr:Rossmann-like and DUF2520 domain-containing protein [Geopsychrobacter electrodiphilus]